MPRVFLDSNVWFSAFYGSENCEKLILAGKEEKIFPVISQQVLKEIIRNIQEKNPNQLENFRNFILETPPSIYPDPLEIPQKFKLLISNEDMPIFLAAITAKVDYFVTGNIKHFNVKKLERLTGIKILTPKQAVDLL